MELELKKYKKLSEQKVSLNPGINLLVGSNGSGKSSLLEFVFANESLGYNRVSYTSGVNESFSKIYRPILENNIKKFKSTYFSFGKKTKRSSVPQNFCIYFDKKWAPFLITTALFLKKQEESICSKWCKELGLKIFNLNFTLAFDAQYRKKISTSIKLSESGEGYLGFQNSAVHRFVSKLSGGIDELGTVSLQQVSIGSEEEFSKEGVLSKEIEEHLFANNLFISDELLKDEKFLKLPSSLQAEHQLIYFFSLLQTVSATPKPVLDLSTTEIVFSDKDRKKIHINDISDGEFQLLTTSALIDLFSNESTILLLDEIDAHIHPSIIGKIWKMLEPLKTIILTSSHNMMSLSLTEISRIVFLDNGLILSEFNKKQGVINSLYGAYFAPSVSHSLFYSCKNIFIFDGLMDWDIFRALCIKIGKNFGALEKDSVYIARSSTSTKANGLSELLAPKEEWIDIFVSSLDLMDLDKSKIRLKNFIVISDRDEVTVDRDRDLCFREKKTKKVGSYQGNILEIVWNRRCIENYLLSKNARAHFKSKVDETVLKSVLKIPEKKLGESLERYRERYVGRIKGSGDLFTDSELFGESLKIMDCKSLVHALLYDKNGLNFESLNEYLDYMDVGEVDPYIAKVFDKISSLIVNDGIFTRN